MTVVATKFTDVETTRVVNAYTASPTSETVASLAAAMGRSVAAVRGKLVSEGVYVAKATAKAEKRETKAEILARVEASLGLAAGTLASFDKGSLEAVKALDAATKAE